MKLIIQRIWIIARIVMTASTYFINEHRIL